MVDDRHAINAGHVPEFEEESESEDDEDVEGEEDAGIFQFNYREVLCNVLGADTMSFDRVLTGVCH